MRVATAKMAIIRVQQQDFEVAKELAMIRAANPKVGAIASFVGLVRDLNDDTVVNNLVLEHYPGMTERSLEGIVREATGRWDVIDVTVIHRVGLLKPLDQIVLVMVASSHRGDAFKACEFIMDYLKTEAPFWKKEASDEGSRWVDARESDDRARDRWKT